MIQIEDLEKIIEIVEKHDISHFEFEQNDSRIVIEKQGLKPVLNNKDNNSEIKVINEYRNDKKKKIIDKHYDCRNMFKYIYQCKSICIR